MSDSSFAPSELACVQFFPAACAVGFILAPLRGFFAGPLFDFWLALTVCDTVSKSPHPLPNEGSVE